mgnify:FL=1|tara:strand:+ start:954 stop:1961 length:1008 start_codon:yes stop_codon:yes gene_type:complete
MVCVEEKLLVNILYRAESEVLKDIDISHLNFEKLIKIASAHLMLPALFFNIHKKNLTCLFPEDFVDYIKNIYSINKARNEVLISEAKELSQLLHKNNINHIFLKGSALILSNVFEDIGERMIGDIDFIVQDKDKEKIKNLLYNKNYYGLFPDSLFTFFKPRHFPRIVQKNKTIAIEPHTELLSPGYRCVINSKELINDFKDEAKSIKTPSKSFLFDHCIYNLQINDRGLYNSNYSHRSIYDIFKINCKNRLDIKNIKKDIYTKHYFLTINKFEIFDINITSTLLNSYFDKLIMVGRNILRKIYIRSIQIVELFVNYNYRKYALNKIINFSNKKTS